MINLKIYIIVSMVLFVAIVIVSLLIAKEIDNNDKK